MKFEAKIMDIVLCNPKLTISSEIIMGVSRHGFPKLFYDQMVGQKWWTIQSFMKESQIKGLALLMVNWGDPRRNSVPSHLWAR
jgi:hypothetical protein